MALSTKAIKTKIGSVKNTKKITKAMEMVAASKMKKAVDNALSSRDYAERALELLVHVSGDKVLRHALLDRRTDNKKLIVVIASNKGLCGGYNAHVRKVFNQIVDVHENSQEPNKGMRVITIGKYAEAFARNRGVEVVASFVDFPDNISISDITALSKIVIDGFAGGEYDSVRLVYSHFISAMSSEVKKRLILPISADTIHDFISNIGGNQNKQDFKIEKMAQYRFEPNEEEVLSHVLPRLTEVQIYQSILESIAVEHSSRMIAMKNASESADEMVQDLTLTFNKARQAAITQEITEIATAAGAVG